MIYVTVVPINVYKTFYSANKATYCEIVLFVFMRYVTISYYKLSNVTTILFIFTCINPINVNNVTKDILY